MRYSSAFFIMVKVSQLLKCNYCIHLTTFILLVAISKYSWCRYVIIPAKYWNMWKKNSRTQFRRLLWQSCITIGPTCKTHIKVVVIIPIKHAMWWSVRPLPWCGSCGTTRFRSACLPTATVVYFTPSDVRARSLVVTRVVVRILPW